MTAEEAIGIVEEVIDYVTLMRDASGQDDGESELIEKLRWVRQFVDETCR